ncbi:uncharacterized protein LOC134845864, partial [Symsagittifera roscoffensis]|uniref:uncharacterized protein LOC134845864 n=1 Tax=Symsagittifera roscoffensis TaxID=84072 RepID=UPI00307CAF4D
MAVFSWVAMGGQVVTLILGSLSVVMDSWWQSDFPLSAGGGNDFEEGQGEESRTGLWYPCRKKCGSVIVVRLCMSVQLVPSVLSSCAMIAFCTRLMNRHNRFLLKSATNASLLQVLLVGLSIFLSWKTHTNFGPAFTVAWASECIAITSLAMMCLLYKDDLTHSNPNSLSSLEGDCSHRHANNEHVTSPSTANSNHGPTTTNRSGCSNYHVRHQHHRTETMT